MIKMNVMESSAIMLCTNLHVLSSLAVYFNVNF